MLIAINTDIYHALCLVYYSSYSDDMKVGSYKVPITPLAQIKHWAVFIMKRICLCLHYLKEILLLLFIKKNQTKPFTFRAEAYPYTRVRVSGYS